MTTTTRADVTTAAMAVLDAQKAATPTLLRATYRARPGSFLETPCAYIGGRGETITYSAQTFNRQFTGLTIVLVDTLIDPMETSDRFDILVDLMVDRLIDAYALIGGGNSILQLASVDDIEIETSGPESIGIYRACVLSMRDTFRREGRT